MKTLFKILILVTGLCIIPWIVKSQPKYHVYVDAVAFYNALNTSPKNLDAAIAILRYYSGNSELTQAQAATLLSNDLFLKDYATDFQRPELRISEGFGAPQVGGSNATGFGTLLADGIAKFLIDRGKQEISIAFFQRMKSQFDKNPELKYLLPNTYTIVAEIESHNILTLLQELRDALQKDLSTMPTNILSIRGTTETEATITQIRNALKVSSSADKAALARVLSLLIMQSIISGDNIINALAHVSNDTDLCKINDDMVAYIKLSSILLESITSEKEGDGLFIDQSALTGLFANERLLKVFLGLCNMKYKNLECYKDIKVNGKGLEDILKLVLAKRNNFNDLVIAVDKVNTAYKALRKQPQDASSYGTVLSGSIALLSHSIKISEIIAGDSKDADRAKLLINLQISADFCIDLQKHNYSGVFVDITKFIKQNDIIKDDEAKDITLKYLAFAANLASATTSDEVKEAIDAIALPPGSYSVKRNSAINIALNGYIGYGWDRRDKKEYAQGIYAPVGLSISTGLGRKGLSAVTLFASIIDVGAIASYRLHDDQATGDLKQDVRLESIVSPSAQIFIGIPYTPIVAGIGWRKTPKLVFEGPGTLTTVAPADVLNIALLIDIPIINLTNKPYKR